MFFKTQTRQFSLQATEIDGFSAWLEKSLVEMKIRRQNQIRLRLLAEELLLRMQDRLGTDVSAQAYLENSLGKVHLRIEIEGDAFNPLNESGNRLGDWNSSLITALEMVPRYVYSWGKNVLRISLPKKKINPLVELGIAIVLGLFIAGIGLLCIPETTRIAVSGSILNTLYGLWLRGLNAFSGPVIFLMALTTVMNTRHITRQGGTRIYVIGRYFLFCLSAAVVALLVALAVFPLKVTQADSAADMIQRTMASITEVIPESFLSPFTESNTPQLLLIAFFTGSAIIILSNRVTELKRVIRQLNMIGLLLAKWISLLVPVFFALFLALKIWNNQTAVLYGMWKPLLLSLGATACILGFALLAFSLHMRVNPIVILQKLLPDFIALIRAGGIDDYFPDAENNSAEKLGIDRSYVKVCLPQGLVLYMPLSGTGILIFTVYTMFAYGNDIAPLQLVGSVLLAVVLFTATPPVPGANLLAYTVFFAWMDLPGEVLIDAMFFDIMFGFIASAGNLTMLQIETATEAKRFGLLNLEKLRAPVVKKTAGRKK